MEEKEPWNPDIHPLRRTSTQKFEAKHGRDVRRTSSVQRASSERKSTRSRIPQLKNHETFSGPAAENVFETSDEYGNEALQPLQSHDATEQVSGDQAARKTAMKWSNGPMEWGEKRSDSIPTPLVSPLTVPSPVKAQHLPIKGSRHKTSIKKGFPRFSSTTDPFRTGHGSPAKAKHKPDHDARHQRSESGRNWSSHDEEIQNHPRLSKDPDSDRDPQSQTTGPEETSSDQDTTIRTGSDSGNPAHEQRSDHVLSPESRKPSRNINEESGSKYETVSDKNSKSDELGISSDTPSSHLNERNSADLQRKPFRTDPNPIDANLMQSAVGERFDTETNETGETPDARHCAISMEIESHDPQPVAPGSDRIKDPDTQSNYSSSNRRSPDTVQILDSTPFSGAMEGQSHDAPLQSPGDNVVKTPDPHSESSGNSDTENLETQSKSPETDNMKSPDPQSENLENVRTNGPNATHSARSEDSRSPEPQINAPAVDIIMSPQYRSRSPGREGVTIETHPAQGQVEDDVGPETWLKSRAPLAGNYKAFFHDTPSPELYGSDTPSNPGSGTDSLVVSPTRGNENGAAEDVDWNGFYRANAEMMRILDECKANYQLQPPSEEQIAKDKREAKKAAKKKNKTSRSRTSTHWGESTLSSEGSLLLFPDQDDQENDIRAEPVQSDIERVKVELENQTALDLIELHRANYQLRKDMEAKEAKFEREIKIAWKRQRPPPTTEEQRRDRVALEDIKSKQIFNDFGDQQRPIKTDPQSVAHETEVNILLQRARISHCLENYQEMYIRANQAVEAASKLQFPSFTARCCYYRGLASYLYRDFGKARVDFVMARGCVGRYGISSANVERYIHLIDSADDPETAILEKFLPWKIDRGRETERTSISRRRDTNTQDESSPSTADDAETLVEDSQEMSETPVTSALPPISPSNQEERSPGQSHENVGSQIQTLRRPSHIGRLPPDDEPQPTIDDVPTYRPREESISEEIRKDIFESKARSLSEAGPAETINSQEEQTSPPRTIASTEWTLLGSTASHSTTRRGPLRPHVAPISTSFATASTSGRETLPQATTEAEDRDERGSDEMDSAEIEEVYASFGGRLRASHREDAILDSASPRQA